MCVENSPAYTVTHANHFQLVENDINTYQQLGRVYLTGKQGLVKSSISLFMIVILTV